MYFNFSFTDKFQMIDVVPDEFATVENLITKYLVPISGRKPKCFQALHCDSEGVPKDKKELHQLKTTALEHMEFKDGDVIKIVDRPVKEMPKNYTRILTNKKK